MIVDDYDDEDGVRHIYTYRQADVLSFLPMVVAAVAPALQQLSK